MIDRINLLPENNLVHRIKALELLRDEIKGAAQLFGSDSVRTARVFSSNPYDIQVDTIDFNSKVVELVFTPDAENGSVVYSLAIDAFIPPATSTGVQVYTERDTPLADGVQKWRIYLSDNDTTPLLWLRLKFYFYASASGTFTATLL